MGSGSEIYIGLMSGTSVDGVDVAIVNFGKSPPEALYCQTCPYPVSLAKSIRQLTRSATITIDQLCQLDIEIACFYAEAVNQALETDSIASKTVAAIGSHGQTIHHNPTTAPTYTLQIGDPNTLSAKTGITVVADFRRRDMALGGQGAPLAPAFHQFIFRSKDCDRVIINIGGIANITHLPVEQEIPVTGYDSGPGNTFLDYWIHKHQATNYDSNGEWSSSGRLLDELLQNMLSAETYFSQLPPKSTGTEYFSPTWLEGFELNKYKPVDVQATLLELTAQTIVNGIAQLPTQPSQCFVSGGGAHNQHLMSRLRKLLPYSDVKTTAELGVDPDYVEAIAFAWFARQTMNGQAGNIPSVTNAGAAAVLGGIFQNKTFE